MLESARLPSIPGFGNGDVYPLAMLEEAAIDLIAKLWRKVQEDERLEMGDGNCSYGRTWLGVVETREINLL